MRSQAQVRPEDQRITWSQEFIARAQKRVEGIRTDLVKAQEAVVKAKKHSVTWKHFFEMERHVLQTQWLVAGVGPFWSSGEHCSASFFVVVVAVFCV